MKKTRQVKKDHYKEKAMHQLSSMKEVAFDEQNFVKRTKFLDLFAMCDATCKVFLKKYCDIPTQEATELKWELSMKIIPSALATFDFDIERNLLSRIFSAEARAGRKSAKKLRNGLVHELNAEDMSEVAQRFESLIEDMEKFLAFFTYSLEE